MGGCSKGMGGAFAPPHIFYATYILLIVKFISFNFLLNVPPQILKFSLIPANSWLRPCPHG